LEAADSSETLAYLCHIQEDRLQHS